ncbi:C-terminal binding protein [Selenomonas sp. TAMA-11512]|uniref:C-terminal binding protein n=1 Tax=Selenomonas sp. TAMA-11512 TaxID=3095337 RepID=UPI00308951F4|nr:C-terminal binding protein [Selenomonas sp. TAMA-11512]
MKVVITDLDMVSIENEKKVFDAAGVPYELKQLHTEEALIEGCKDADILAVQYAKITEKVMDALPNIKFIVRYGVGVDSIDVPAATKHGIQVGNVPDYGMNEVADHAVSLSLALLRKVDMLNRRTKTEVWDYSACIPIRRFSTMTVGVVGLGRIGRNFAAKMSALGFKVVGYDPYYKETPETSFIEAVSFDEVVERADVISLHCPADGNEGLMNRDVFKRMKKTAFLINVARGAIVNDKDLDEALKSGEIAGAGLDTVSIEPAPPDYFLFKNDNLLVTPHMAWYSEEAGAELQRKVAEEAVRFAKGEPIHYPINKLDK